MFISEMCHLIAPRIDCCEERISTTVVSLVGLSVNISFPRVRAPFVPIDPNWQVHTQVYSSMNVPELKMHSWDKLNLSMKEAV